MGVVSVGAISDGKVTGGELDTVLIVCVLIPLVRHSTIEHWPRKIKIVITW